MRTSILVTAVGVLLSALTPGRAHGNEGALVRSVVRGLEQLSRSCPLACGELARLGAGEGVALGGTVLGETVLGETVWESGTVSMQIESIAPSVLESMTPSVLASPVLSTGSPWSAAVQLPLDTPPEVVEATTEHIAGVDLLMTEMEACAGDGPCLEKVAEQAGSESFWRRILGKSCTYRHPAAMKNLVYGYVVNFSALAAALRAAPHEEFPFHLVANTIVMSAVWNEVGCRAELEGGLSERSNASIDLTWAQRFKRNYLGYLYLQPVGIGAVLAFATVEDLIRGKEVLGPEQLKTLLADATYQIGYGAVVAIPKGLLMNPAFFRWLPRVHQYLGEVYARTTLKVLPHQVASWAVKGRFLPGAAFDYGARSLNNTFDTTLWLKGRQLFVPGRDGHIKSEESPGR